MYSGSIVGMDPKDYKRKVLQDLFQYRDQLGPANLLASSSNLALGHACQEKKNLFCFKD